MWYLQENNSKPTSGPRVKYQFCRNRIGRPNGFAIRCSATNKGLPRNNRFYFQGNAIKVVRQQNMAMNPVGLGTKNCCAGEDQQQFSTQSASQSVSSVWRSGPVIE
jgi:hypothetical protein